MSIGTTGPLASFSGGATGLLPATATAGPVVLSGTLNVANGGTGEVTAQAASQNLSTGFAVADLAALKALTSRPPVVIVQTGQAAGVWQWVSGSATTANDGTVVACTSGAAGRYKRVYSGAINLAWFGPDATGATDSTIAILAWIAAGNDTAGEDLYAPAGTYLFDGGGYLNTSSVVSGAGSNATIFSSRLASPTSGYLFVAGGWGSGFRDIGFVSAVTQTSGQFVQLTGAETFIEWARIREHFQGVLVSGAAARVGPGTVSFDDIVDASGAYDLKVAGGDVSIAVSNVFVHAQSPVPTYATGILLDDAVATTITTCSVLTRNQGLVLSSTALASPVLSTFIDTCFFDNCTYPVWIQTTNDGAIYRIKFNNTWSSGGPVAAGTCVTISSGASGTMGGLEFINQQSNLCPAGIGYSVTGVVDGMTIRGGVCAGNLNGVNTNGNINDLVIENVRFGEADGLNANSNRDISLGGTTYENLRIANNIMKGSTIGLITATDITRGIITNNTFDTVGTPIWFFSGTLTDCLVVDNPGYNPVGAAAAATMGASPFTVTAGVSPETHYVVQSATNTATITVGGQGVATVTSATAPVVINLGPNESYITTWVTTAPTYVKMVH